MLSPALASPCRVCCRTPGPDPRLKSESISTGGVGGGSFFLSPGQPGSLDGTDRDNRSPKSWVSESGRLGGSVAGLLD